MAYWVVGGEFTDTRFVDMAKGRELEHHGPYRTYREAYEVWSERAWQTVDNCHCRFRVLKGDKAAPPALPRASLA